MQKETSLNYIFQEEEPINIREQLEKYLFHWKWFVVTIVLALAMAYAYSYYIPNKYRVATSILIGDESIGGLSSELSAFKDLGLIGGGKKSIENEIGILKSYTLMERVVKELGVHISFYKEDRVRNTEIYNTEVPFKIAFFSKEKMYSLNTSFTIRSLSASQFEIVLDDGSAQKHVFGENVSTKFGDITVTPTNTKNIHINEVVRVVISPLKNVVDGLRGALQVGLIFEKSSLLELSLITQNKEKATAILNELVQQYNRDAVADKNLIGNNTSTFINERLAVIEKDLSAVDKGVEDFKSNNRLTGIPTESMLVLKSNEELRKKIIGLNTQIRLTDYVMAYITENKDNLIPPNLGLNDGSVDANTVQYNALILERNRILKGSSDINPIIVNLNSQIAQLRASISQGLVNLKSSLTISLNDAKEAESKVNSRMVSVPKQEREFRDIQRQQQIIESLYLYLLQKREENAISLAVTVPNAKVIDTARGSDVPISPKRKVIYMMALALGLAIPIAVIYLMFLFDNKVHNSKEVEAIVKAPLLGEIPNTKDTEKVVVHKDDRSGIAESFRMIRTNLDFMLAGVRGRGKTIFVSSTVTNEGKTFIALNLASVLVLSNKKVLLIGADIRKPRFEEYLNIKLGKGLTHYLTDSSLKVSDVIEHVEALNIDVLHSGVIPPNPSELLSNGRFEDVLAYGKEHYDFVIVDTAPVKLVTDTMLLGKNADLFIYTIRANYSDKRLLEIPAKLYKEKRFPNLAVLLNDVDVERGYGYGYGYGEVEVKKPWWKKR
ncbi:GumC family protein [Polaribacter sp. L3A8]|uniref:GumC family protein n=1 Tax=Polaribacter sp. L3A8 TaxID=2686361 RepID=UPI00131AB53E|nr:polysaccharide biosynthesis tyrosine autokinase [Polaribacter sp. L3A8]